ncbi:Transposon, En/Spm-like protein [Cucumis melo var. makuwa]|uniref:Transposon, En/Spm-like protein n=1 Tax=Cucumis melo var. makuwa TaxID=1194695 RepID=A0A5D3BHT5_CUCMM|nr:Transposon, En/Spm-like protein [Cucumis melo var. makuwa]TYJ98221.1 Transposon, En/Spm-like protein [Cucumis melo var. makuwa]
MDDEMVEMIHDLHGPMFEECRRELDEQDESDKISGMFPKIKEKLYPGCLKFTSFNFLVKLMHIKLSASYYEAKKRLRDLGMGYESIHVDGIQTYDSFNASFFQLRAALLWTINDFPTYGDLAGWRTKGTILNIDGKTKDTIKAREDLANLKIRKELHIQEIENKRVKSHASYTLTTAEKVDFCTFLKSVKFSDGFASSMRRSEIELFQLTCSNEKKGWVNKEKAKYDEMVELKTTSSQEGSEPLLESEICKRVLGKRSGHVKGQGWGPRLKNARNETIQHNTKETNAHIAHMQSIVESQQATIEAILRRLSCQEATSNMERSSE